MNEVTQKSKKKINLEYFKKGEKKREKSQSIGFGSFISSPIDSICNTSAVTCALFCVGFQIEKDFPISAIQSAI